MLFLSGRTWNRTRGLLFFRQTLIPTELYDHSFYSQLYILHIDTYGEHNGNVSRAAVRNPSLFSPSDIDDIELDI